MPLIMSFFMLKNLPEPPFFIIKFTFLGVTFEVPLNLVYPFLARQIP